MGSSSNVALNRLGLWLKNLCGMVFLVGQNIRVFDVKSFWNNVKTWHLVDLFRFCIEVLFKHIHYLVIFFQKKTPIHMKIISGSFLYNSSKISLHCLQSYKS